MDVIRRGVLAALLAGAAWLGGCVGSDRGRVFAGGGERTVAWFWTVARPGDTFLIPPGTYRDPAWLVRPPAGTAGLPGRPITVRARRDGTVLLDGRWLPDHEPIRLKNVAHIQVEGVDACRSYNNVVMLWQSPHCTVRRVCAWDASPSGDGGVFAVHYSPHARIEDCAGWGTGRWIYTLANRSDYAQCRRCWGRWEGSTNIGSKNVFRSISYGSRHVRYFACIGTWDMRRMPAGQRPENTYGIFGISATETDGPRDALFDLCLAYTRLDQTVIRFNGGFFTAAHSGVRLRRCIAAHPQPYLRPFYLYSPPGVGEDLVADGIAAVGGDRSRVEPPWQVRWDDGRETIRTLRGEWKASPILGQVRRLAGEDVLAEIDAVARRLVAVPKGRP